MVEVQGFIVIHKIFYRCLRYLFTPSLPPQKLNEGKSFNCETLIMDSFLNISSFQMQQFTVTLTTPISQRKLWLWCLGQWHWKGGWCCKKKGKRIKQRTRSLIVVDCDALILVLRDWMGAIWNLCVLGDWQRFFLILRKVKATFILGWCKFFFFF